MTGGLVIGVIFAPLCAYSDLPAPAMYNHLLAFFGFGLLLVGLGLGHALDQRWRFDSISVLLLILVAAASLAAIAQGTPLSMALCDAAALLMALAVLQASKAVTAELRATLLRRFFMTLVIAGLLSVLVGAIQLFAPGWTDNLWIANTNGEGRAVGNMRQPNQLATLLLWSAVGAVGLAREGWLERRLGTARRAGVALGVLLWVFVLGILFSASRTGMIGIVLLALWGIVDAILARSGKARLHRSHRLLLAAMPVMWLVSWPIVKGLLSWAGLDFFTDARIHNQGAQSAERLLIFRDTFALIKAYPWTGTGWGAFNFHWTLTPFPGRYAAFVDHTHNIFLQLIVELGLPIGTICSLLLLAGFGTAAWRAAKDLTGAGMCAFLLVVMVGVHSLTEFPLWYVYFLLPTALAFGLCLGTPAEEVVAPDRLHRQHQVLIGSGLVVALLVPLAAKQYLDVVHIYAPPPGSPPLAERIVAGQGALFYDVHADYAVATVVPPGPFALAAAERAGHRVLDVRLLIAWAQSLAATGQTDKARYVAERIREFHHPLGVEFFRQCEVAAGRQEPLPFQCASSERSYLPSELRP